MPVLNRLPIGGVSGGSSGGGKINLFTQLAEPATKDGIWIKTSIPYKNVKSIGSIIARKQVNRSSDASLPYNFVNGCAVVLDGEIHLLGGSASGTSLNHYSWNGLYWTKLDNLPYDFYDGSAVIFKNRIYILGGTKGPTNCYYWNGSKWIQSTDIPYKFKNGDAVVYDDKIHIFGGNGVESGNTNTIFNHYTWGGKAWTKLTTLPHTFVSGAVAVYKGKVHILGGTGTGKNHTTWDGSDYNDLDNLPISFSDGCAVAGDRYLHIIGGTDSYDKRYHYDGKEWTKCEDLPYSFISFSALALNNKIHILGGCPNGSQNYHYFLNNNSSWAVAGRIPNNDYGYTQDSYHPAIIAYDGELHFLGGQYGNVHYSWNGTAWTKYGDIPYNFSSPGNHGATVYDGEIYTIGGGNGLNNFYSWNGSDWTKHTDCPDSFYNCITYDGKVYVLGTYGASVKFAAWDGKVWTSIDNLPFGFTGHDEYCDAVAVYHDEMHIISSHNNGKHYSWNGTRWKQYDAPPLDTANTPYGGCCAVIYGDEIHVLTNNRAGVPNGHWSWNGTRWKRYDDKPLSTSYGISADAYSILGTEAIIHCNGGELMGVFIPEELANLTTDPNTVGIQHFKTDGGKYSTCLADLSDTIKSGNARFESFFDDVVFSGDKKEWDVSNQYEYYYGNGTAWKKISHAFHTT